MTDQETMLDPLATRLLDAQVRFALDQLRGENYHALVIDEVDHALSNASTVTLKAGIERILKEVPSIDPGTVIADRIVGKPYKYRKIQAKPLPGVANLGIRPTVGGTRPLLEVHLFDFDRDIYGAHISVRFVHKLRNEQRFPNIDALKAQIAADAANARAFFEL